MVIFRVIALRTPNLAYCPYFVKSGALHKISVLQEKQDTSSNLHRTNALTVRIFSTYTGYSGTWNCQLCVYHRGPQVEGFATHNFISSVAVSTPVWNRGNMKKYLLLRCLIPVRGKTSELKPTHKYCRLCDSVAQCRCLISFPLMVMSLHISCLWATDKTWRVNSAGKLQFVLGTRLPHSAVNKTSHIFLTCFPSLIQYNCCSYIHTQISHIFSPLSTI